MKGFQKKLHAARLTEWKSWYLAYDALLNASENDFEAKLKNELARVNCFYRYVEDAILEAKKKFLQRGEVPMSEPERELLESTTEDGSESTELDLGKMEWDEFKQNWKEVKENVELIDRSGNPLRETKSDTEEFQRAEMSPNFSETIITEEKPSKRNEAILSDSILNLNDTIVEIEGDIIDEPSNQSTPKSSWTKKLAAQRDKLLWNNIFYKKYDQNKFERDLLDFIAALKHITAYQKLNYQGFIDILKNRNRLSKIELVERAYFVRSKNCTQILKEAVQKYQNKYHRDDPEKAKRIIRGINKREPLDPVSSFFAGAIISIVIMLNYFICKNNITDYPLKTSNSFYNYYFSVLSVQMGALFFGLSMVYFHWYRINSSFIFDFTYGSKLTTSKYLLFVGGMMLLHQILTILFFNHVGPSLVIVFIAILCLPFDMLFSGSRYYILGAIIKILMPVFFTVKFKHFFLADVIQSFSGSIDLLLSSFNIPGTSVLYLIAILAAVSRFFQCLRRYYDEGLRVHLCNALKYMIAITSFMAKFYKFEQATYLKFASVSYGYIWDIVFDWNLFRSKYLFPFFVYALIVIYNTIARFCYLFPKLNSTQALFVEIVRRFLWVLIRVEHEHLNNCNHLTAMKYVKMPTYEAFYKVGYEPLESDTKVESEQ